MFQGSKTLVFVMNESGKSLDVQHKFMKRLKKRIKLQQVNSVDLCDVIIAFVTVVSRVGTDIVAALKNIPTIRPVVLIVLHHTFDKNYLAPDSNVCLNRDDAFAADLCWYEDIGLLRCLANDVALKTITEYLSPNLPLIPVQPQPRRRIWILVVVFILLVVLLTVLFIYFLIQPREGQNGTPTTLIPLTVSTQQPNTTAITWRPNITVTTQRLT